MGNVTSQYPIQLFDGYTTGNPDRDSREDDCKVDSHDYDQLAAEIIALQSIAAVPNIQATSFLYVDKNRTDALTPDGSLLRPFRTIEAAMLAASILATETNRIMIGIFPGRYVLPSTVNLIPFVSIGGVLNGLPDSIYIESSGEVFRAPTSMNLGGACLSNLLLSCTSTVPTDWAIRIQSRGNVLFQNVSIFSTVNGVLLEGDSVGVGIFMGVSATGDAVKADGTSFLALEHGVVGGGGGVKYDLILGTNATVRLDSSTFFYNALILNNGTLTYSSIDSQLKNTSTVSGTTVKDALNTLAHIPDPSILGNGYYRIQVTDGVVAWVIDDA